MSVERVTRRRTITILAAGASGALLGGSSRLPDQEWQGTAMGADARIIFSGIASDAARAALAGVTDEIERLERVLSVFRADSEITRLNRDGRLEAPSAAMRGALALALAVAKQSGGLFDPTVQSLWEAHVDWFAAHPAPDLPPETTIVAARAAVDWRRIVASPALIALGAGQRITLNGLGQGYVTDRVADLLRARGFRNVLIDLGEQRALGPRAAGAPWTIARAGAAPIALREGALATSEGVGCRLGANPAAHHLFDPRTGRSAMQWRRLTVHHRSAAMADALSTALYAATPGEINTLLARVRGAAVWAHDHDAREWRWGTASG